MFWDGSAPSHRRRVAVKTGGGTAEAMSVCIDDGDAILELSSETCDGGEADPAEAEDDMLADEVEILDGLKTKADKSGLENQRTASHTHCGAVLTITAETGGTESGHWEEVLQDVHAMGRW